MLDSGDVSSLLDERSWSVVQDESISKDVVRESLNKILNVKAFDLHMNSSQRVISAELGWDCVVM